MDVDCFRSLETMLLSFLHSSFIIISSNYVFIRVRRAQNMHDMHTKPCLCPCWNILPMGFFSYMSSSDHGGAFQYVGMAIWFTNITI